MYTASALSSRVDEIVSSATTLNSAGASYFDSLKLEVKDQIDRLKTKERRIFKTLHVDDNDIEELNERIVSYKNAVFRLTGQSLDQSIISVLKDENEKINQLMERAINEIIGERIKPEEYLFADGSKNLEKFKERYIQELNDLFGQNRFSSKKGITMDGIFYAGLTKEQQKAWKSIIAKRIGLESGYSEKDLYSKLEINEQLSGNIDNIQFNWFDTISVTPGSPLTPTEAEKIPKEKIASAFPGKTSLLNRKYRIAAFRSTIAEGAPWSRPRQPAKR